MSHEYNRRAAIIESLRAGHSAKDIIKWFNYPKTVVYDIKTAWDAATNKDEFTAERKPHRKRSDAVRTAKFVTSVPKKVKCDPSVSMSEIAQDLKVSKATIHRTIHQDLNLKSYVIKRRQLLTKATKERRRVKASALINELKHQSAGMLRFFSDEKNFIQDRVTNKQNDRWLTDSPENVPISMHSKYPAHVMVLGVVSNEGDVMSPIFFPDGLRLGAKEYIKLLTTKIKPWMDEMANGREYVFQQDSAPAHTARITQAWLYTHVPHHWSPDLWPPSSPDCNPLDYYVWGVLEKEVNKRSYNTKDELISSIKLAMDNLSRDDVAKACSSFRSRLEKVIEVDGGHFE